jgi:hypothetical protein
MMNCCSSGTAEAVFIIGTPLWSGWKARDEPCTASPLSAQDASVRRHFCTLRRLAASKQCGGL